MSFSQATTHQNKKLEVVRVKDPFTLLPILKERHPVSCMIYNQVIQFLNYGWKDELTFYTIGDEINSNTWIVSNCKREDYGSNYQISAPTCITTGEAEIPDEIKECFRSDSLINWSDLDDVVGLFAPRILANMIYDVSVNFHGNITEVHPMYLYYMDIEDAVDLKIMRQLDDGAELRRLDPKKNEGNFILETWKYTLPGTEIVVPKCITRNASAGIFVDGKCVCGLYIPAIGFISALYTLEEYRKKGYAKLAMNFAFKEYAKDGCIPCATVELQNEASLKFFKRLGLKVASVLNCVLIKKLILDK